MEIICYSCGRGEHPENSIEGIMHCQQVNPDWRIEMDLRITKDQQIVLFHDATTERTTGTNGQLRELNLQALQQLNIGYHFKQGNDFPYRENPIPLPTLDEVCQLFPQAKLLLDVHTDNQKIVDLIITIIEQHEMEQQIVVVSEYDSIMTSFKTKRPAWEYGAATKEVKGMVYSSFLFLDRFFPIKADILMLPVFFGRMRLLTNRVINHIVSRNKRIWIWLREGKEVETINGASELQGYKSKGVHGVFTEFPAKLKTEIDQLGTN